MPSQQPRVGLTRILCVGSTTPSSQPSPKFSAIVIVMALTLIPFASTPTTTRLSNSLWDRSPSLLPESTQNGDFNITASSPQPKDINQSETTTITIGIIGVVTQEIDLTASPSSGLSCGAITPPAVTGDSNATASCVSSIANNYTLTITGRSGSLSRSATVTLAFMDFAIYATSPRGNANSSISSTISVRAANGFSGSVTLSATPHSGLGCGMITPAFVTGSGTAYILCQASNLGTYSLTISGTSDHLIHLIDATFFITKVPDFSITATSPKPNDVGQRPTSTITVQGLNAFNNQVTLVESAPSNLSCQGIIPGQIPGPETATVSCTSKIAGEYVLNITGTSDSLSHSTTARFDFVDFKLTAFAESPSNIGSPVVLGIAVTLLNGFSRPVTLVDSPAFGLQCNSITQSVLLSGTALVSCEASVAGQYMINVTGTSAGLTHSVTATLNFQDFLMTTSTPETVGIGAYAELTITLVSLNGFAGTVHLADVAPAGLNCKPINPNELTTIFLATLSCESDVSGSFSLTIEGDSSSIVHRVVATFTFGELDFRITTGTSSLNITKGNSGATVVSVAEMNGLSSPVSLSVNSPDGLACSLNPISVDPQTTSTLTCEAINTGDYVVTVTGTGGGRVQNARLSIHVSVPSQASPMPSTLLGLGTFIWYGIGTTLAVLIVATSLILKKSRRPKT